MKYTKAIVAAVGAAISVLTVALADNLFSMSEVGTLISVLIEQGLLVWGVFQLRNVEVEPSE